MSRWEGVALTACRGSTIAQVKGISYRDSLYDLAKLWMSGRFCNSCFAPPPPDGLNIRAPLVSRSRHVRATNQRFSCARGIQHHLVSVRYVAANAEAGQPLETAGLLPHELVKARIVLEARLNLYNKVLAGLREAKEVGPAAFVNLPAFPLRKLHECPLTHIGVP